MPRIIFAALLVLCLCNGIGAAESKWDLAEGLQAIQEELSIRNREWKETERYRQVSSNFQRFLSKIQDLFDVSEEIAAVEGHCLQLKAALESSAGFYHYDNDLFLESFQPIHKALPLRFIKGPLTINQVVVQIGEEQFRLLRAADTYLALASDGTSIPVDQRLLVVLQTTYWAQLLRNINIQYFEQVEQSLKLVSDTSDSIVRLLRATTEFRRRLESLEFMGLNGLLVLDRFVRGVTLVLTVSDLFDQLERLHGLIEPVAKLNQQLIVVLGEIAVDRRKVIEDPFLTSEDRHRSLEKLKLVGARLQVLSGQMRGHTSLLINVADESAALVERLPWSPFVDLAKILRSVADFFTGLADQVEQYGNNFSTVAGNCEDVPYKLFEASKRSLSVQSAMDELRRYPALAGMKLIHKRTSRWSGIYHYDFLAEVADLAAKLSEARRTDLYRYQQISDRLDKELQGFDEQEFLEFFNRVLADGGRALDANEISGIESELVMLSRISPATEQVEFYSRLNEIAGRLVVGEQPQGRLHFLKVLVILLGCSLVIGGFYRMRLRCNANK